MTCCSIRAACKQSGPSADAAFVSDTAFQVELAGAEAGRLQEALAAANAKLAGSQQELAEARAEAAAAVRAAESARGDVADTAAQVGACPAHAYAHECTLANYASHSHRVDNLSLVLSACWSTGDASEALHLAIDMLQLVF